MTNARFSVTLPQQTPLTKLSGMFDPIILCDPIATIIQCGILILAGNVTHIIYNVVAYGDSTYVLTKRFLIILLLSQRDAYQKLQSSRA